MVGKLDLMRPLFIYDHDDYEKVCAIVSFAYGCATANNERRRRVMYTDQLNDKKQKQSDDSTITHERISASKRHTYIYIK